MRKLVNGQYVNVSPAVLEPRPGPDRGVTRRADWAKVVDPADVDEMTAAQLLEFLKDQGVPANARWKESTLRAKALELIGEGGA